MDIPSGNRAYFCLGVNWLQCIVTVCTTELLLLVHKSLLGHAGIYLRPSDIGCQYSRSITLRASSCGSLVVSRTRRRIGDRPFLCCTASMEQATDGAETAAIDGLVSSWSENISVSLSTGTRIRIDSVMRPRSSSRGCNTIASVTVKVTVTVTTY